MNEFGIFEKDPLELFSLYELPQLYMKGGGGGSSGKVNYPSYMKDMHEDWLDDLDTLITGTNSPYISAVTWDPDTTLEAMEAAVAAFSTAVSNLNPLGDWETAIATAKTKWDAILSDDELNEDIQAFSSILDDEINDVTLPQFKAGMREANAVMTSAFVMGEAKIWSGKTKEIAKYGTGLKLQSAQQKNQLVFEGAATITDLEKNGLTMEETLAKLAVENYRIKIVAKVEECQRQFELDELDAKWPFELYQYGGNMLASIGGGTATAGKGISKTQSAIGGALSGAAAGAMVTGGNPVGAAIGGVIGLGASLF